MYVLFQKKILKLGNSVKKYVVVFFLCTLMLPAEASVIPDFSIQQNREVAVQLNTDVSGVKNQVPAAPEISSDSFSDSDIWYSLNDAVFQWSVPDDVIAVAVEMSTSSNHEPSRVFDSNKREFIISPENATSGVQYLAVQFKNKFGWGEVSERKIQIDTEPPMPFNLVVQSGSSSRHLLMLDAVDSVSGIDYYEVIVDEKKWAELSPSEVENGYELNDFLTGDYSIVVTAIDKAGNKRDAFSTLLIAGPSISTKSSPESSTSSVFKSTHLILILLFLLVIAQFIYILQARKKSKIIVNKLLDEIRETQEQTAKIFSALRDEIYDQVNDMSKRSKLSKKEKEVIESLNLALEVSETLIEKEIMDVERNIK